MKENVLNKGDTKVSSISGSVLDLSDKVDQISTIVLGLIVILGYFYFLSKLPDILSPRKKRES